MHLINFPGSFQTRVFIILLVLSGCSTTTTREDQDDWVSVNAALNQAQASYLRGCVEAFQALKLAPSFPECREKSIAHRLELNQLMQSY